MKMLTDQVRKTDADAARFVHWGATSQDVADTAMSLLLKRAEPILIADLLRLEKALADLSESHKDSVMLGRTLLQPAPPVTFGLKAAGWLASVRRGRRRLQKAFRVAAVLQFGGASGTLASLGDRGIAVAASSERRTWIRRLSRNAVAHSARPTGDSDLRLRSADWIPGQNGARYQSADAGRGGRGGGARRRWPRRILNHAEQAQSHCLRH